MADLFTASLAGLCAVLVLFIVVVMEAMPLTPICEYAFMKKAIPLFLIVSIITYIII